MAKTTLIMILFALSLQGCITDTLADAGVEVSPELQAMGIDPGTKHDLPCPQCALLLSFYLAWGRR